MYQQTSTPPFPLTLTASATIRDQYTRQFRARLPIGIRPSQRAAYATFCCCIALCISFLTRASPAKDAGASSPHLPHFMRASVLARQARQLSVVCNLNVRHECSSQMLTTSARRGGLSQKHVTKASHGSLLQKLGMEVHCRCPPRKLTAEAYHNAPTNVYRKYPPQTPPQMLTRQPTPISPPRA